MKIIHCADLHLDSAMTANLTGEKRKERKAEILHTFERMLEYASVNQVDAILIAGDLYDTRHISAAAKNTVYQGIISHPEIEFYYLRGNHDEDNFLSHLEYMPENLKLFGEDWISYHTGKEEQIVITGAELGFARREDLFSSLVLESDCFHIVMLHGQTAEYEDKGKTDVIPLRELRNKGIHYLALGHLHQYQKGILDAGGVYCYSGCLEGRGFDECGEHGFVLLTIEKGACTQEFIPFSSRTFYTVEADLSDIYSSREAFLRITEVLDEMNYEESSFVKVVLTGGIPVDGEIHIEFLKKQIENRFYFVKIADKTHWKVDREDYMLEESLQGEFVRTVMGSSLSEEDKTAVIRYGIQALAGEEII